MIRILPIASGSTGNCMLLEIDGRNLLIDIGVSARSLFTVLSANGLAPESIDAVLITHTHSDHIRGLDVSMKKIAAPLFMSDASKATLVCERAHVLPYWGKEEILPGLWTTAFRTSHDCPGSVGFRIETESSVFGFATDLGVMTEEILRLLAGADCVVLESNHDVEMLRYGPYPVVLKRRILSESGHLSNDDCARALVWLAEHGTSHFLLAHLSQKNNLPRLALTASQKAAAGTGAKIAVLPVTGSCWMDIPG